MGIILRRSLLLIISLLIFSHLPAQETKKKISLGFDFALGTQKCFPYNNPHYLHNTTGFKLMLNYPLKGAKFSYEILIEPSIYLVEHQLLNKYFIQPSDSPDYLLLRELYCQKRSYKEYALNIGFLTRYNFNKSLSTFILVSVGPLYGGIATERLAKGFAFSDIIDLGLTYRIGKISLDLRPGIRHVSNADTKTPNSGHNSSTISLGISYSL